MESLASSVLMKLGWLEGVPFRYGAFEVQGRGVELLSAASLPVTVTLLVITAVVMYREHREGGFGPGHLPRFMAAFVLAFMLGSKVLSPQYMIWLLPLVPLSAGGVWGIGVSGVFLTICLMTTQIYPNHYDEIRNGMSPGIDILLGRNLILLILWVLMLSLPSDSKLTGEPAAEQGEGPS